MRYDVDYFIDKFKAIPPSKWTTKRYTDPKDPSKHCALGHCGMRNSRRPFPEEAYALSTLFLDNYPHHVSVVNDRVKTKNTKFTKKTPKGRILAALRDIKKASRGT